VPDWQEWIQNVEKVFQEHNEEMTQLCKDLLWANYDEWRELYFAEPGMAESWVAKDPWLSQLDWEVRATKGKYAHVPEWVRPFIKDPETNIGVKSRLAHLLLKLEWEGKPLTWIEGQGWCYWSDTE
jgi:DNA polymerase gamma 1